MNETKTQTFMHTYIRTHTLKVEPRSGIFDTTVKEIFGKKQFEQHIFGRSTIYL